MLFVCVKPYGVKPLLAELAPVLTERHLIVSIAAGVTLADIEAAAGGKARAVRVMPNTPCMVGAWLMLARHSVNRPCAEAEQRLAMQAKLRLRCAWGRRRARRTRRWCSGCSAPWGARTWWRRT